MSEQPTQLKAPTIRGVRWRHKKTGGIYRVIATGFIEADLTPCVIYESEKDGNVWVRPASEFLDGRFERVAQTEKARAVTDDLVKAVARAWASIDGKTLTEDNEDGYMHEAGELLRRSGVTDRIEELEAGVTDMHEGLTTVYWSGYEDGKKAMEAKLAKAVEALSGVMVGGNHLALLLPDNFPPAETKPLDALEIMGAGRNYEVWCCWRSIMLARTTLAELTGGKDE